MKTKGTKKAAAKKANRSIPYEQIARLAEQGFGAMEIAVKTNRVIPGSDGSHSIRAILSKMRTAGYKNSAGKVVKLKIARVGFEPKATKKNVVVMKKKATKKVALPKVDGKTLAAGGGQ